MQISAVIITYNEEVNIERCLKSLQGIADEIVVVDSFSTDKTEEICKHFEVNFVIKEWLGYSAQKNFGNNQAKHNYILSLDADEALSDTLKESILKLKKDGFTGAYSVNRLVNYCGDWIYHTSWYPDTKTRIWNKLEGKWTGDIHEELTFSKITPVKLLKGDLLHYTYYTVEEHLMQQEKFADLWAKSMFAKGKKAPFYKLVLNPAASFFKDIVVKKGFLDGKSGFTIAKISAQSVFLKYSKLRDLYNQK